MDVTVTCVFMMQQIFLYIISYIEYKTRIFA